MLPTTERQLRKKYQSLISGYEHKIEWHNKAAIQERTISTKRQSKIVLLESKLKKYRIGCAILMSGIMLHLILKLW